MKTGTFYIVIINAAFRTADVVGVVNTTRRKANTHADLAAIREHTGPRERIEAWSYTEMQRLQRNGWSIIAA